MWLEQFTKLIDSYFTDNFRQHGVKKFFEIQQQELKGYAKHIRRHIETLLFNDWAAGTKGSKSILEIEKYAQILRDDCADRIESFKQQIAKLELQLTEHANAAKLQRMNGKISDGQEILLPMLLQECSVVSVPQSVIIMKHLQRKNLMVMLYYCCKKSLLN